REAVDLDDLVRDVAEGLAPDLARAGSSLDVRGDADVVGQWDRFRMSQVVHNLLTNAIKFGRGRPIEVVTAIDGHEATLTERDQGVGMSGEVAARIFDPFERGVSARHHGGLGLGLYIVS